MTTRYAVIHLNFTNMRFSRNTGSETPEQHLTRVINTIIQENGGGKLIGSPFNYENNLYITVDTSPITVDTSPPLGGKSRAKNSYKKYMKKTRKRN